MPRIQKEYGSLWKNKKVSGIFRGNYIKPRAQRRFLLKPTSGGKSHIFNSWQAAKKLGWFKTEG